MIVTSTRAEWFHEYDAHLGAMNTLSATIANLEHQHPGSIPNLRGLPTLLVGSDYSGFHQGAGFEVTSFVITNLESLSLWDQNRMHLRKRYLPEGRRMSYKALNDGRRRAALLPFLKIANHIPGLLLSIAIDKNLRTIFCSELAHSHPLFEGWKPAPTERAMRTMHFASLLLRGLSSAGQDLWWFTDQDEVVANEQRLRSFVSLMGNISSHYLPHALRHMRVGTTASDTGRRDIEGFVAIPDFVAGALQGVINSTYARCLLDAPSIFVPTSEELQPKARRIMDWFADNTQNLRRLTLIIDEPSDGKPRITPLRFHGSREGEATARMSLG